MVNSAAKASQEISLKHLSILIIHLRKSLAFFRANFFPCLLKEPTLKNHCKTIKDNVWADLLAGSTNYEEIATYDNMQNPQLLAKPYSGHEYSYTDSMVPPGGDRCSLLGYAVGDLPGKYDYRLLCRSRDGGITVPQS